MNFYDFHIGDYASRTAHLEPMEDLAYRRCLDLYYMREGALPADVQEVARLVRLRGQESVLQAVLSEFFHLTDAGWTHDKCDDVIAAAQVKRTKAQASANKRWGNAEEMPAHSERTADALPTQCEGNAPSPSPSPTTHKKESAVALLLSKEIPESLARDFLAMRKAKKAPLTATALAGIEREADKAGYSLQKALETCCARGWQGFEAIWVQPKPGTSEARTATVPGSSERDPALKKLDEDAKKAAPPSLETLAAMAEARKKFASAAHQKGQH